MKHGDDTCGACGARLVAAQRYCLSCGERRWPLPAVVAAMLGVAPVVPAASPAEPEEEPDRSWMPDTRAAAVAVMAILGFGVIVGSVVSPPAESAPNDTLVAVSQPQAAPARTPQSPPASTPSPSAGTSTPVAAPVPQTTTIYEKAPPAPTPSQPAIPPAATLPPIHHVFLIVLTDHGYDQAFGPGSQAPYLSTTLTKQGELLANYYGVTSGNLANEIALISGQGPTPETQGDCPTYADVTPGTPDPDTQNQPGQIDGSGCVYPRQAVTLPDELVGNGNTWKAYVEDQGNGAAAGEPATCRHPAAGAADPDQAPRPSDAYVTWRNPFVYFHSIADNPGCAADDVGLDQLATDLKSATTTPTFSYIVPNRCHDGAEEPCAPDQPAGLAATDAWLKTIVPEILASPAYKADGMLAITFDQAPQTGPNADSSACCYEPRYPNLPQTVAPGETPPPGATATTPTDTTPTDTTTSTTPTDTTTTSTTPTTTTTTPAPTAPLPPGADTATGGGGRVGLLLLTKFVKPGTVNTISAFNHFSLLRSIEEVLGLQQTGYASYPGLLPFDSVIYNAPAASTASASAVRKGSHRASPRRASARARTVARTSRTATLR